MTRQRKNDRTDQLKCRKKQAGEIEKMGITSQM